MGLLLGAVLGNKTGGGSEPCSLTQQQLFPRNICSPQGSEGALSLVRKVVGKEAVGRSQAEEMRRWDSPNHKLVV